MAENTPNPSPTTEKNKSISFLTSSVLGIVVSIIVNLLSSFLLGNRLDYLGSMKLPSLPLVVWVAIGTSIYVIVGYVIISLGQKVGILGKVFRVPIWSELRNFGDQRVARISYLGLILIPLLAFLFDKSINGYIASNYFDFPENLKLIYFASWSFSIALIAYGIGCPKEIRKERKEKNTKNVNLVLTSVEQANVHIEDEKEDHPELDESGPFIRAISFLFYLIGISLTLIVLFRGASIVYNV